MVMTRDQSARRCHNIKIYNSSFEWVEEFKYFGTTITNQNSIQEEIKISLNSGNVCYHSVQNLMSSSLLSRNTKIKIYRTIILPVVLYGCETLSLTLREEHRLRVDLIHANQCTFSYNDILVLLTHHCMKKCIGWR